MISDKIKGLLTINGKNVRNYCEYLGILEQAGSRKIKANTFKADELIHLAELTGTHLAFIDNKGNPVITFDVNDIPTKEK